MWPVQVCQRASVQVALCHAAVASALRLVDQTIDASPDGSRTIMTRCAAGQVRVEHRLHWQVGTTWLTVTSRVEHIASDAQAQNHSSESLRIEALTGAVISDVTPFAVDDAPGRLWLHRFRSTWSAEGRHEARLLEDCHLERSWGAASIQVERFGQVGSMPVRGFVPWVGIEDRAAGVTWAMQPDAPASWQCDCLRREDGVSLAAGPADAEFGRWWVDLAVGESVTTDPVRLVCVEGDVDDACDRLVAAIAADIDIPAVDADCPVAFNEWCTSWGTPTHDRLTALAERLAKSGIRYLTIDAGWFLPETGHWHNAQGDWQPNAHQFPHGLAAACDAIRGAGLIPGLWFEWEVVGINSSLWDRSEWLLQRHGKPITVGERRFLDVRLPAVRQHLHERMLELLQSCGIGYLKMDYNETVGAGPDGVHGPGAELRCAIGAAQEWVRHLRKAMPQLVVECCASGGHRLEPSWLRLVARGVFQMYTRGVRFRSWRQRSIV